MPTSRSRVASTPQEAEAAAEELGGPDYVVKAQVLAGGRGKGTFSRCATQHTAASATHHRHLQHSALTLLIPFLSRLSLSLCCCCCCSGFRGGVHTCISPSECRALAGKMLNSSLITHQTGPEGKPCHKVLISERLYLRREAYFAILMDRESQGPVMVASPAGGMDIEKVAAETPKLIFKEKVDIIRGVDDDKVLALARTMGFSGEKQAKDAAGVMKKLYRLFKEKDATLVEINPLAETHDGRILTVDAKVPHYPPSTPPLLFPRSI